MFYVYVLRSQKTEKFYIGQTQDISNRVLEHNNGKTISTRSGRPWVLVHTEVFATRSDAIKRERELKSKKSHQAIEILIQQ
jgi:putative endonuclease